MDDQIRIEQDHDSADRFWLYEQGWRNKNTFVPECIAIDQEGFIGEFNMNPMFISILVFVVVGFAFFIVGLILL